MDNQKIQLRVRSITRDLSNSIFRQIDVQDYINESIDRVKEVIPQMDGMQYLAGNGDIPILLPASYHYLLAIYAASRCFFQDERHYQATTLMNEFEAKMDELKNKIDAGDVVIKDATGTAVEVVYAEDYVDDNYFTKRFEGTDLDLGVDGGGS